MYRLRCKYLNSLCRSVGSSFLGIQIEHNGIVQYSKVAGPWSKIIKLRSYLGESRNITRSIMADSVKTPQNFRMALVQMSVGSDKTKNLDNASKLIEEAAQAGAKMIALPECFNSPYGIDYFAEYAEKIPSGETFGLISSLAKKLNVYIIAGSIPELGEDSKLYNTCMVLDPTGKLIGQHRKVHLFDIDVPGKITFQESKVLTPGNDLTIVDTEFCKVGVGICYDLRFPEMAQLYRQDGCHLLVYPGAFNMTTGPAHWELLQRSRAVDNQVYVATIAPARDDTASYRAWGHSMAVNPWGSVMVEAQETQAIIYANIDFSYMEEVRNQIPVSHQKRHDLYKVSSAKDLGKSSK